MYVNVEQLKNLLLHYDSLKPYYVGRHWRTELGLTVIHSYAYIAILCACNYELYYYQLAMCITVQTVFICILHDSYVSKATDSCIDT